MSDLYHVHWQAGKQLINKQQTCVSAYARAERGSTAPVLPFQRECSYLLNRIGG